MNWNDALNLIDVCQKPGMRYDSPVSESDISVFAEMFNIYGCYYSQEFSERMLKHWVCSWICTDTAVGLAIYCLDGVPVAVSSQSARKSDEVIEFLSVPAMNVVRQCVMSYVEEPDIPLANLEEVIDPRWFDHAGFKVAGL